MTSNANVMWWCSGIFAYLNHLTPKTRAEIVDILLNGLKRLEYRGYDSAGIGIDGGNGQVVGMKAKKPNVILFKRQGKVQALADDIDSK